MGDNWDDSDDEWDVDDDALDAKLGLKKDGGNNFDDEEDLALKEQAAAEKLMQVELKKKGSSLVAKKNADKERKEEAEDARKAMELEAELEANMSPDEQRAMERARIEEADHELTADLFGGVDKMSISKGAQQAGDKVVMKDMKDHMKHARKVAECMKGHGKIHLAAVFLKEVIQQSKDVLDDDAITDIIKTCNVIKNEKVQQSKRKVKGQAQKSKKADKSKEAKAKKLHDDVFGENDNYDAYDQMGGDYEDDFF